MVTHSLELQAMADQCIDIKDLKPQPLPQKLDQPEDLAA
jgi:ABC-type lipoprotein export system ATPase subunit